MISAQDAVRTARSLIGTPYTELDCINLVKKVIRTAPGGDPKYTTAGTSTLWASGDKSGKYRDLTWRRLSIEGAEAGMLVFKGQPKGSGGEPHHVGIATGEGTVVHSSSVRGEVVETPLSAGDNWTLLAVHRLIAPQNSTPCLPFIGEGDRTQAVAGFEGEQHMNETLYKARITAPQGGNVNFRSKPSTSARRVEAMKQLPSGETVQVLEELNGWFKVATASGLEGYVACEYLTRLREGTFGVFLPCSSEDDALKLSELFSCALVIQHVTDD